MDAPKNISLFIPHILPKFTQNYVAQQFSKIGQVDQVDFISKFDKNGQLFYAAYIHFNGWYPTTFGFNIQENLILFGKHHLFHDNTPYYWILLPNTSKRFPQMRRKHTLNLTDTPTKITTSTTCPYAPHKYTYSPTPYYSINIHSQHVIAPAIAPAMSPIPYPYIPSFDDINTTYEFENINTTDEQEQLEDDCQTEFEIEWFKHHHH